jgi:hypothetical protein
MDRGAAQPTVRRLSGDEWFGLPEGVPGELVDGLLVDEDSVPGCAGLSLNLDELWAELDSLEEGS